MRHPINPRANVLDGDLRLCFCLPVDAHDRHATDAAHESQRADPDRHTSLACSDCPMSAARSISVESTACTSSTRIMCFSAFSWSSILVAATQSVGTMRSMSRMYASDAVNKTQMSVVNPVRIRVFTLRYWISKSSCV